MSGRLRRLLVAAESASLLVLMMFGGSQRLEPDPAEHLLLRRLRLLSRVGPNAWGRARCKRDPLRRCFYAAALWAWARELCALAVSSAASVTRWRSVRVAIVLFSDIPID